MKTKRRSAAIARPRSRIRTLASSLCFGVLILVLVASSVYIGSSASSKNTAAYADNSTSAVIRKDPVTKARSKSLATNWLASISPPAPFAPDTLATYEATSGACTNNPKSSFLLGEDVCVKASAELVGRRLSIAGTDGTVADIVDVTVDPQELVFTLPTTTTSVVNDVVVDNRGIWRATVHSSADFGARANVFFSVADPANAAADLIIFADSTATDVVEPGSATGFAVVVQNAGPDAAANVHVTQNVPTNMTFDSATAGTGTAFSCSESSGVVDCVPGGSLATGATSTFTLNYTVSGGAANAVITSEVDIASATTDPHPDSNKALARVEIRSAGTTSPTCVVTCPLNRTVSANTTQSGQPGAFVNFAEDVEPTGDCGAVTSSPASGSFFSVAGSPHTVTVSSSTGGGSCSFTITVTETAAPTISCAADQTESTSGASNEASVTVNTPTATGTNVQVTGVRNDNRSLSDGYPVGTTTITWTARECNNPPDCDDPNARFASCTQRIIVTSPDAPTISCPSNKSFPATDCAGRTLSSGDIGTPTASGSNVVVSSRRSDDLDLTGDPYPVGVTTITWTATDDSGRIASCTQTITITSSGADSVPPTLDVPPDVFATTSSCSATLDDELGVATASDNCGSVDIKRTGVPANFNFPTGTTIVTYTATDNAGNVTTKTQRVVVAESPAINPTITAPPDVTVNTGAGATSCGAFVSDGTLGTANASDNCAGVSISRTGVPAGNVFPVGTTFVTYTATDASGNTASAVQNVTVVDNTPPVVTPPAAVTLFTGAGATSCGVTVANLDATLGTGSATDNCAGVGAVTRSGVPAGNVFPVGTTTVTYSATDAHGNTASATQVVTVVDNTPPVISCPANITLEPSCPTGAIATYSTPTATDNCGVQSVNRTAGLASGSVFPIGTTTVTHLATDIYGNTASCSFTVTVLTPQAVINNLIAAVSASSLTGTQKNGLLSKLNAALTGINSGQTNVACNKLSEFVNSVGTLIGNGSLTSAQGNSWINSANHLRNTIGCTSLPCS